MPITEIVLLLSFWGGQILSTASPASTFLLLNGFLRECGNTDHGIVKAGKDFKDDEVQPSDSGAFFLSSAGDEA